MAKKVHPGAKLMKLKPPTAQGAQGHQSSLTEVGMIIAAAAASFGFKPGLDQTIFMVQFWKGSSWKLVIIIIIIQSYIQIHTVQYSSSLPYLP